MILPTIGLIVLAIVIVTFVLEPILRARGDVVALDAAAMPNPLPEIVDEGVNDPAAEHRQEHDDATPRRTPGMAPALDPRPAGDTK